MSTSKDAEDQELREAGADETNVEPDLSHSQSAGAAGTSGDTTTVANTVESEAKAADDNDENDENADDEDDVIRLPSQPKGESGPGPLTKTKLVIILIVLFSVFLDYLGMSLIQPILPFYAEAFNATATELGALYSSYAAMGLIASLGMGVFSDRYGRKPAILFSLFGTMAGYLCLGLAQNYGQLLAFRFLTGIFGGSAPVASAVIADLVPKREHSKYMASIGAVITLSFIVGPALGSGLSVLREGIDGLRIPFYASSGLGAAGLIVALVFVKESNPDIIRKRALAKRKKNDDAPLEEKLTSDEPEAQDADDVEMDAIKVVKDDASGKTDSKDAGAAEAESSGLPVTIWLVCLACVLNGMGSTVYTSMVALYLIDEFALATVAVGYVTLSGSTVAVFMNFLFVFLTKKFGMWFVTMGGSLWFATALIIAPSLGVWGFLAAMVFGVGVGFGVAMPAYNSMAVSLATAKSRGRVSGLINAASGVSQVIGPMLHGALYGTDTAYPFYVGAGCCVGAAAVLAAMAVGWPEFRCPAQTERVDVVGRVWSEEEKAAWRYRADVPTRRDYMRLGKAVGTLMSEKNYLWVKYFDAMMKGLDVVFPTLSTDSFEAYNEDISHMMASHRDARDEFNSFRYEQHPQF